MAHRIHVADGKTSMMYVGQLPNSAASLPRLMN